MELFRYLKIANNEIDNLNIFWICWMFFMWGVATSMIFTLLPIFIVEELGGGYRAFGLLEGGVIFISFISKLLAGVLIDIFKKKIPMLKCGTILTVVSKISLACAWNIILVFIAKAIDRFAKGLRAAPSDAILADISTRYGFAYSIKYMMNVLGSLTGSLLTSFLVFLFGNSFRFIFTLATIPTIVALYILNRKITYESDKEMHVKESKKWDIKNIRNLPREYWNFIIIIAILMFARFSEGFITLKAKDVMPNGVASFPIFMALYEICVVCVSIPIGKVSDKIDKKKILLYGILILFMADILAIVAYNDTTIILTYIGAGIHMGATHGILSSVIAESTGSKNMIGTAFAIYYAIDGVCLFFSNYFAGISDNLAIAIGLSGSSGPFLQGAIACLIAMCYIILLLKKEKQ
jgi:MFS family permease